MDQAVCPQSGPFCLDGSAGSAQALHVISKIAAQHHLQESQAHRIVKCRDCIDHRSNLLDILAEQENRVPFFGLA